MNDQEDGAANADGDDPADGDDHADHEHHPHDHPSDERTTAPQSAYTTGHVAFGFVVALVGVLVTFGVPLLLA